MSQNLYVSAARQLDDEAVALERQFMVDGRWPDGMQACAADAAQRRLVAASLRAIAQYGALEARSWKSPALPPMAKCEVMVTVSIKGNRFVELGYWDGAQWRLSDGRDLGRHVIAWRNKPAPAFEIVEGLRDAG